MELSGHRLHKSLKANELTGVTFGDLTVLTGANGSGKTHLLELLSSASFGESGNEPLTEPGRTRFIEAGELLAMTGPTAIHLAGQASDSAGQLQRGLAELLETVIRPQYTDADPGPNDEDLSNELDNLAIHRGLLTEEALSQLRAGTNQPLWELGSAQLTPHAPLGGPQSNPFADNLLDIFSSWIRSHLTNDIAALRVARGETGVYTRSSEDMLALVGPPPWDVFNETLKTIGLPFKVNPPADLLDPQSVRVDLVSVTSGLGDGGLRMEDLSSGERTLLGLALVLTNLTITGVAPQVPAMVLLDEPDATLHPSMVDKLLMMLRKVFNCRFGIRVILTTHSPSTVALAPRGSIMLMDRLLRPRLRLADTDEALSVLTAGIPTLSVKTENRRQVFVEADADERIYTALWNLLKDRVGSPFTPVFIGAGKAHNDPNGETRPGGSTIVKTLVRDLRRAGSETVIGLIDRDKSGGVPEFIYQLRDRYAIENLILDPLLLGVHLVTYGAVSMSELGFPSNTNPGAMAREHPQQVVQFVADALDVDATSTRPVSYLDGQVANVPVELLDLRGHDLDHRVIDRFKPLRRHNGSHLHVIAQNTVRDYSGAVPQALVDLFGQMLR